MKQWHSGVLPEGSFRRFAVLDRDDDALRISTEFPCTGIVGVDGGNDEAPTMKVERDRERTVTLRNVNPDRYLVLIRPIDSQAIQNFADSHRLLRTPYAPPNGLGCIFSCKLLPCVLESGLRWTFP